MKIIHESHGFPQIFSEANLCKSAKSVDPIP